MNQLHTKLVVNHSCLNDNLKLKFYGNDGPNCMSLFSECLCHDRITEIGGGGEAKVNCEGNSFIKSTYIGNDKWNLIATS